TSQALVDAQAKLNDPALKAQIAKLNQENEQLQDSSSKVSASVATAIASNAPLVEKVRIEANPDGKWGIVFSGDNKLEEAKYEVETNAPRWQIPNASIYFRQGSYRSVA